MPAISICKRTTAVSAACCSIFARLTLPLIIQRKREMRLFSAVGHAVVATRMILPLWRKAAIALYAA